MVIVQSFKDYKNFIRILLIEPNTIITNCYFIIIGFTVIIESKKGEIKSCLLSLTFLEDYPGEKLVHGILHDISSIKKAESSLVAITMTESPAFIPSPTKPVSISRKDPLSS
jgi:hypothetical protein